MKKLLLITALLASTFAMSQTTQKVQCKAITAKGTQCKRMAVINGYCRQHDPSAKRCSATTKAGKPCRNLAIKGSDKCSVHLKNTSAK